ncbi:MAG: glycosyltransferase family 2 protein, partial [Desulfovibrionaceae bacterium]|nr:glycosyltransferase family 2 protein [Desulfovibrionaceae bacterium]
MLLAMVTYTHNDAELLNGLLASLKRWGVMPAHVFVIDDASSPAYALPGELMGGFGGSAALGASSGVEIPGLPGIDVIRPGSRLGPAQAKSFGIGLAFDAGADAVLSIDCDMRLPRNWLGESLHILGEDAIGLVGCDPEHGLAGDTLSNYLREFEKTPRSVAETHFLGAGVWLLRQDVWHKTGGLAGHGQYTHEDLYFSRLLKNSGYRLIAQNNPPASQVRRLGAAAHFRRQLRYLGFAVLAVAKNQGVENALALIGEQSASRLDAIEQLNQPAFAYFELLWLSSLLLYLAKEGVMGNCACSGVTAEIENLLTERPRTLKLLTDDLEAMQLGFISGLTLQEAGAEELAANEASDIARRLFEALRSHAGLLSRLEDKEVEALREERQ